MHRLPNIVVPPRMPSSSTRDNDSNRVHSYPRALFSKLCDRILPLDLSRTSTRVAIHLPTLYFMFRILLLWTIVLAQTSNLYPIYTSGRIYELGKWSESKEMAEINWYTFLAICAAFCVEALVRALDGAGMSLVAHLRPNTSPFNLVCFMSCLCLYLTDDICLIK